ncbi:MAG: GNAT family N-acetyltransferase [bacterium]|nr:GNAT family N-acetyltransferase [bacterium]MCM1375889.1 GNAT family N-acetyltransferase [Muribaculum sp.]
MQIRRAQESDMEGINRLLYQVLTLHHNGRPDLFKGNAKKYDDQELLALIGDEERPIFVGVEEKTQRVLGYAFCIFQQHIDSNILTDIRTLYIDDLCVEEECRGRHIGRQLYEYVLDFARGAGCYNVTLNVWSCNDAALRFYEKCGLVPQKIGMEQILQADVVEADKS